MNIRAPNRFKERKRKPKTNGILQGTGTETKTKWSSTVPEQKRYSEIPKKQLITVLFVLYIAYKISQKHSLFHEKI